MAATLADTSAHAPDVAASPATHAQAAGPASPGLASGPPAWWRVLAVCACALLALGVHQWVFQWQAAQDQERLRGRLELFASTLTTELARVEALPGVLALDRSLVQSLRQPRDDALRAAANTYLRTVQQNSRLEAAYLMDTTGTTLAASNHDQPDSFVSHNYAFRPYTQDALAGRTGHFFGVGTTTGRAGYFLSAPVRDASGQVWGAVAIKVSLEGVQAAMERSGDFLLLGDELGVIFLTSDPALRYRTLGPLSEASLAHLRTVRQYVGQTLAPVVEGQDWRGQPRVRLGPTSPTYDVAASQVGVLKWQLLLLDDSNGAQRLALVSAVAVGLAGLVAVFTWQLQWMRRRRQQELHGLEEQVNARIAHSTRHLQTQVAELERTEKMLRQTTDSAVQAGKLAVLGQMSAGITHELTQPLTAMRHYAENALPLMDQGQLDAVRQNLMRMNHLTVRMEQMVTHLRFHVRKQPAHIEAVAVATALDGALDLLQMPPHRARQRVQARLEPDLRVMADAVRLEQVLVNLLRNALEAGAPASEVQVWARVQEGRVAVGVRDHGQGIAADAMPHLFEPFFSTKPAGSGLGLGLAVSKMIVSNMGGRIRAANCPDGGAEFVFELPLPPPPRETAHEP